MGAETVSVVFTDLVGSTALLSEIGEEAAEALRREHFSLLRSAAGTAGGREVKNLGDGLMLVFPSAADAVAGAAAIQQSFERRNRAAAHPLLIRVGVSVGDADVDGGDYFGTPVIEAARLCALADGGCILVTDVVRLLAGSRGGFDFEDLGEQQLKGLDVPVQTWQVRWRSEVEPEDGPSLPPRLASSVSSAFVGRVAEHELLRTAWKSAAADGERRVVLLSGEPGIGKTTLSAEFASHVHGEGGAVVYGRCDEDLGIPYQPWIEALGQLVGTVADDVLAGHVAAKGGVVGRLVPELEARIPARGAQPVAAGDGDAERFVLFGAVVDLLERASADRPLLVVLDDLHWADRPTVQLLRHVVGSDRRLPVVVLGTFRDSEVAAGHALAELLAALHRERGVERVALRGLSDADLLELLEQVAGHEMDDDGIAVRDAVLAETAGNPFFVGEILRHMAETGAIRQDDGGRWVATVDIREVGLPISLKEVVGRRLAGLGADTERALALAAVIGRDFDVPLLAAVADLSEDAVVDLCDAAVFAAVLQTTDDPDRYTFAHALIEHTLYDGLSPARRARAHRAVAEHLEEACGDDPGERAGELAHHWAAAVRPTDAAKAVHYALVAAARAEEQLAPEEAVRWYTEALELLDRGATDERRRCEILVALGEAQRQAGIGAHRETLLDAARLADRIDGVDLLVQAALANNRGFQSIIGGIDSERVAVIDRALERLGEGDAHDADRARLLALATVERLYVAGIDERLALGEAAVDAGRRSGDPAALVQVLAVVSQATCVPWTLDRRIEWGTEACELGDRHGDTVARFLAHMQRAGAALESGDGGSYVRHRQQAAIVVEHIPQAAMRWNHDFTGVVPLVLQGDLQQAEQLAEAALAFGVDTGQPDPMPVYAAELANIRFHQGRWEELLPLIEQALVDMPGLPVYRAVLAHAHAISGDRARGQALLDEDRAGGFAMPADQAWSTAFGEWAQAACRLGDTDAAAVLRERLLPFHDQVVTTYITVACGVAHHLGCLDRILGRLDDADRWFAEAMAIHRRLSSPLLVTYTEAAWAAMLADRGGPGDLERAHELASSALATANAGGFGYIAADAADVLERLVATR